MTTFREAAEATSNLAKQYRSVLQVAEVLARLGDLEQAEQSFAAARDKALTEASAAGDHLVALKEEIEQLSQLADNARQNAADIVQRAEAEAAHIRSIASCDADELIAAAHSKVGADLLSAQERQQAAQAVVAKLAEEKDELEESIGALKAELAALRARIGA